MFLSNFFNFIGDLIPRRLPRPPRFPHSVGHPVANPWLLNAQRRLRGAGPFGRSVADVSEVLDHGGHGGEDGDPLAPVGPSRVEDAEQRALFEEACADYEGQEEFTDKRPRRPLSLDDLHRLLRQQGRDRVKRERFAGRKIIMVYGFQVVH